MVDKLPLPQLVSRISGCHQQYQSSHHHLRFYQSFFGNDVVFGSNRTASPGSINNLSLTWFLPAGHGNSFIVLKSMSRENLWNEFYFGLVKQGPGVRREGCFHKVFTTDSRVYLSVSIGIKLVINRFNNKNSPLEHSGILNASLPK